tara:strand:+ start:236 stop:424 length:189 start_codon:yes stop_codon:yes gene_type:complete
MESTKKNWENMSNSNIRINLESLRHQHEVIKTKIDDLISNMKDIELDFLSGNEILIKRVKGE